MPDAMEFYQSAILLNAVQQQATGQAALTATDTSDFVSAAQTTLKTGYDPVINAINQVLSRTIFSIRPYNRKFGLAEISDTAYGNHVRKISIADKPIDDDDRYKWPVAYDANQNNAIGNGESVDQQIIKKPEILQTNFYGANVWQDHYTIFRDQLDCAFSSPEEFSRFIAMITGNMSDKIEQIREDTGRAVVMNSMIGTYVTADTASAAYDLGHRVIPLLTLYNAQTGLSLTATSVFEPDNFAPFIRWAFSIIMSVSDLMEQRSEIFQTIVNGKHVMRHTPRSRQKMFIASQALNMIATMVRVNNYNDGFMALPNGLRAEGVAFWQSIKSPLTVTGTAGYIGTDGAVHTSSSTTIEPVFAYLFDEEALGYSVVQDWSAPSPFNARGGYTNIWLHQTLKVYNDHSEKSVVFTLA